MKGFLIPFTGALILSVHGICLYSYGETKLTKPLSLISCCYKKEYYKNAPGICLPISTYKPGAVLVITDYQDFYDMTLCFTGGCYLYITIFTIKHYRALILLSQFFPEYHEFLQSGFQGLFLCSKLYKFAGIGIDVLIGQ